MRSKRVIWLNLTVESLCMFQIWKLLILDWSTCSKESIDYKFVAIGSTEQKLWINWGLYVILLFYFSLQNFIQYHYGFSTEMCSTQFKDFRDIKFAIFGQVYYFISILQVLHRNWNLKFEFELELTGLTGSWPAWPTWQPPIGWYRFG
jgi:hypothetical protein